MIEALHTGMMTNVSVGGEASESFSVIKQGCVRSSPSSYQQCSTRLSETWGMESTYSPDRPIQRRTLQSKDQDYSDTDERAAIRR